MLLNSQDKIFVAGHNGMVGQSIVRSLLKKGYCNPNNGGHLLTQRRSDLNLLNFEQVDNWFNRNRPNIVIIAAAKVGGIKANSDYPFDFIFENLKIQQNIIENSWKYGVRRLLFLGSSCIYPKFAKQPIKEDELLKGSLESTNEWYAIAKIAGIKLCEALRLQHDFDAISLMPTNLYGNNDNYDLKSSHAFPALIRKFYEAKIKNLKSVSCWGDGSALREFLHVEDFAKSCLYALDKWDLDKEDAPRGDNNEKLYWLNVGSGTEISIKKLAEKISHKMDFDGEIIWDKSFPNGTPRKILDSSRFRDFGWKSEIGIDEGIEKTIESFKKEFYS